MGTCGLVGQIGVYTGWVSDIAAGTKAVSYTHLDVYKRQVQDGLRNVQHIGAAGLQIRVVHGREHRLSLIHIFTGIQNIRDVLPFPRTAYGF